MILTQLFDCFAVSFIVLWTCWSRSALSCESQCDGLYKQRQKEVWSGRNSDSCVTEITVSQSEQMCWLQLHHGPRGHVTMIQRSSSTGRISFKWTAANCKHFSDQVHQTWHPSSWRGGGADPASLKVWRLIVSLALAHTSVWLQPDFIVTCVSPFSSWKHLAY